MHRTRTHARQGFSLLEVLIALAIMSMIVAMALPSFQGVTQDAEETALEQQLQRVRTAIEFYAFQHNQILPGTTNGGGSFSDSKLIDQLTLSSDIEGDTDDVGTVGYPYGPYLTDGFPVNPINEMDTVMVIDPGLSKNAADDTTGWVYFAETGEFRANCSGTSTHGDPLFEL